MNVRILLTAASLVCLASTARGQQLASSDSAAPAQVTVAPEHRAISSSMDRPSDAVRREAPAALVPMAAPGANLGQAKAMMIVGGAAFLAGAIIGGDAGTIVMLGGVGIGGYGLWLYLR